MARPATIEHVTLMSFQRLLLMIGVLLVAALVAYAAIGV